ncbi:MAG: YraN family protein [Candidatus Dojkabacteria bacterium]|nr:YraN family protein [Candidatus Dojkabacteria bacterium]MDQ7021821.1 YraN family protein [Candidatus Dojkabacteria bacterium]
MSNFSKGKYAEHIATKYLTDLGYIILENNFYTTEGELDIIARYKEFIVFIEVKSLSYYSKFSIYSTLIKTKRLRIKKSIYTWLRKYNLQSEIWRLDFIGIILGGKTEYSIEHFKFVEI